MSIKGLLQCSAGLVLSFLALSCAEKPDPYTTRPLVPAAVEKPSAQPALGSAIELHAKADGQSSVTAERVRTLSEQLTQVEKDSADAVAELDRLRASKFSVESDLVKFYNRLVAQEKLVKDMTLQVKSVEESLLAERALREQASAQLLTTSSLLRDKETEASLLREQLSTANTIASSADKAAKQYMSEAASAHAEADKLKGVSSFKTKLLVGSAIIIVLQALFAYLLIRFRTIFPF